LQNDDSELTPICPFCEKEVDRLIEVKKGYFTTKRVYCCPHCRKIVGVNFNLP
jgi:hypothetical protein